MRIRTNDGARRRGRLVSVVGLATVLALTAAACGSDDDSSDSGDTATTEAGGETATTEAGGGDAAASGDLSITFIPKQLNNPYTDVVLGGGEYGASEAGFGAVQHCRSPRGLRIQPGHLHQRRDPGWY